MQVKFCLRSNQNTSSLDSVGREFCRRMFEDEGESVELLTPRLLLGVSACQQWEELFNEAFFTASFAPNSTLVEALAEQAKGKTLDRAPIWYYNPHTSDLGCAALIVNFQGLWFSHFRSSWDSTTPFSFKGDRATRRKPLKYSCAPAP